MLRRLPLLFGLMLGAPAVALAQAPIATLPGALRAELQALQLTPAQRTELMLLLIEAQGLRATIQADVDGLLADTQAELAQPDADLRALATQREALVEARLANLRTLRDELLDFYYDDLDVAQQARVRALLLARVERIERMRAALLDLRTAFVDG